VVKAILDKHNNATNQRRFNSIVATSSINHAIEYYNIFKETQEKKQKEDENYEPLNVTCVFSPPAQIAAKDEEGNSKNVADIKQLQDDLPQEKADNQIEPEKKKTALMAIIADYNRQYGTNHSFNEFDLYYQDVQQRIKDQKYSHADYPRKNKIDVTIVVDMLLTGFDSKYLNTLYVDKNLKHHGLIQAFSRTNRVLNDTKPWGNILDFRYQEHEVDAAIALFSGTTKSQAREIWLVDPAPKVVEAFNQKVDELHTFMTSKGLACEPSQVHNLKGDTAKAEFINHFKEVQKLKTQLDQYTDLDAQSKIAIEQKLPTDTLRGFKAIYLDTAMDLKRKQGKDAEEAVRQLDFDLVLFSSAVIDYDYIMALIAKSTQKTGKQKMTRQELIDMISASAIDFIDYVVNKFPFRIKTIRTDNGHEFQAKFNWYVHELGMEHVYIKPAIPRLNGKVERSHLTDKQEFYQLIDYTDDVDLHEKLAEWEAFYNCHRPHSAHGGKTPYEVLKTKLGI
jgi:type I restriction enzyme R subunit